MYNGIYTSAVLICHQQNTKKKIRAVKEIDKISDRELWLIGIALYWAEGTKEKEHTVSEQTTFSNSDPNIHIYFKKHTVNLYRKNQGDKYMGVFRIRLRRSSELNRKIAGWTQGICQDL